MGLSRAGSSVSVARVFGRGTPAALALLKAAWPSAVGPELARRTEVLALEGSAMRVRIPDARWRKVLHRMQPEILERLRGVAGDLAPRRLGFSEGGPVSAPQLTEAGSTPAEVLDEATGGARTRVFRSGASPPTTEAGSTPAEVLDEATGGARTPMTTLPDGLAVAARCIDDPEIRARFERSAARYLAAFRR
jgi:hypothetical protein